MYHNIKVDFLLVKFIFLLFSISLFAKSELSYIYDPDWKPFEYKDKMSHIHMGIVADILGLVSEKSGLKFLPLQTDTWQESVNLLKSGKADMASAVPWTKQRAHYLNFTKNSIYSYPAVLVTNKDFRIDETFDDKNIVIVKGNSLGEWIQHKFPKAKFTFVKNVEDGFKLLENEDIDFFGINGVSAKYYINVLGYEDSKIYTILDYRFQLKIALLKSIDTKTLNLIDNALSQITKQELRDIYYKWTNVKLKKEINWKVVFYIVVFFVFVILFFVFINKRLNKLVNEKTAQLKSLNETLEKKVQQRTKELESINKKMLDNIKYASLIQNSILPQKNVLDSFFKECEIIWQPRDMIGGDIYLFKKLNEYEAILLVVDCTGHGVSGAFVTMLVKAIEEQLLAVSDNITTSKLLQDFNNAFKKLLLQEQTNIDVGFDTAVVHVDKNKKQLTFSGAKIPLYFLRDGELCVLKPNRHSVGYVNSDDKYNYKEHKITIFEDDIFYISTDGYTDQNGGNKGFPFGKKRFKQIILENFKKTLAEQKDIFLKSLEKYQQGDERNDDITLVMFKV